MSSGLSADGGGGSGGFTLFLGFELAGLLCRRASNVSTLTAVCVDKHIHVHCQQISLIMQSLLNSITATQLYINSC